MKKLKQLEVRSAHIAALIVLTALLLSATYAVQNSGNFLTSDSGGLEAHYRFDTGAGNTAHDVTGSHDGSINGASWVNGIQGKALSFDGADDTVDVTGLNYDPEDSFSVSYWLNMDTVSKRTSFGSAETNSVFRDWYVGSQLDFWWEDESGNAHHLSADPGFDANKWYHVYFEYNGDRHAVYVNGRKIGEDSIGNVNPAPVDNTLSLGSSYVDPFDGKLDNIRLYSKALNDSQIKSLHNQGSWRIGNTASQDSSSKVLDLSFQHKNSTNVYDLSGKNNHGQPRNGASQETAVNCKVGRCYSFDGDDDHVRAGIFPSLGESNTYTIQTWFKMPSTETDGNIIHMSSASDGTGWCGAPLHVDSGNIQAWSYDGSAVTVSGSSVNDGSWHHASTTWNGTHLFLYLDGRLEGTTPLSNYDSSGSDNYIWSAFSPGGCSNDAGWFEGEIDQIKVFNRSLSQQEIAEKTEGLSSNGAILDMRFDNGGGDHVEDYSRSNNHGKLMWNESYGPDWARGVSAKSLRFDGYDDRVEPDLDVADDKPEHLTVSAWYKTQGGFNSEDIVSDLISSPDEGFVLRSDSFAVGKGDGNGMVSVDGSTITGEWTHVLGTYDGSEVEFYQNGEKIGSTSFEGPYAKSHRQLVIGYNAWRNSNFDAGYGWKGKIDEVEIYPYAVSELKAKQMYSQGKDSIESTSSADSIQNGLVLDQSFDRVEQCGQSDTISCPSGMTGGVAVDESGEANHGELVNNPTGNEATECRYGRCINFDGSDNYISASGGEEYNFTDVEYALSAWVKTTEGNGTVIAQSDSVSNLLDGYALSLGTGAGGNPEEGEVVFQHRNSNTGNDDKLWTDGTTVNDGEWHHIAAVSDGGHPNTSIYIDGEKQDVNYFRSDGMNAIASASYDVTIGGKDGESSYLNGSIDEARIYNRSLSKQEVWRLYTKGRDRSDDSKMAGPVAHYPMQREASPLRDISGEGNHGDLSLLGESGTFNTSNGKWKKIRFERSYDDPVVVGTTNTQNGEAGLVFETRRVSSSSAEMRLCESKGAVDGCDTHGTERAGYVVIDAAATDDIPGIEAGSFRIGSEIDTTTHDETYSGSFSSRPMTFFTVQTNNGPGPIEAWPTTTDASGFAAGICKQVNDNNCDTGHPEEEVGWVAIEPGNEPFEQQAEADNLTNAVTNWATADYTDFSDKPVGLFEVQDNAGGQDPKIDEIRNLDNESMEVRFCELENDGDTCDGHASMEYAYFAAEEGLLTYSNGNFPRYVDTERGKALSFDGNDDYVEVLHDDYLEVSNTGELTISGWVQLRDHSKDNWERLLEKGGYGSGGYSIQRGNPSSDSEDDKRLSFYFANSNGWENSINIIQPSSNTLNEWHFFTVTLEDNEVTTYFDGRQTNQDTDWPYTSTTSPLYLGAADSGTATLTGSLNGVRIYPYALDQNQVKQVMNGGGMSIG